MEQAPQSKEEILNEAQAKINKSFSQSLALSKPKKHNFARLRIYFTRFLIALLMFFCGYALLVIITADPKYTKAETLQNSAKLEKLIADNAPEFEPTFSSALKLLEKQPGFYNKVVNNIHDIKVKTGYCQYACIYYETFVHPLSLEMPEANFSPKTLIINPKGIKKFADAEEFASLLVHEADHVEYIESTKLRRAGLFIKCSPLLNPHISVFSNLFSISHRIKTIEICAEKAQIKFHKATNTESGYEFKNSFLYNFYKFMGGGG